MRSFKKIMMMVLVGAFAFVPMVSVDAAETDIKQVSTGEEFLAAIKDENVTNIELTDDIEITERGVITTTKNINGNGHKITYTGSFKNGGDNTTWGSDTSNGDGIYVILAWHTDVTLSNITLTGGNVGLSANGANVTLEGTIDVSGNGFGGIELTKGAAPTLAVPSLTINNATIVNTTETDKLPTLWTDNLTTEEVESMNIEYNGVKVAVTCDKEVGKPLQVQLFLDENNLPTGDNYVELDAADFRPEEVTPEEPVETEDPKEENKDEVKDEEVNPKTSDGIILTVSALSISAIVAVIAKKKLA